jgi:hypothetical protein
METAKRFLRTGEDGEGAAERAPRRRRRSPIGSAGDESRRIGTLTSQPRTQPKSWRKGEIREIRGQQEGEICGAIRARRREARRRDGDGNGAMLPGEGGGGAADAAVEDWVGECGRGGRERERASGTPRFFFFASFIRGRKRKGRPDRTGPGLAWFSSWAALACLDQLRP